MRAIELFLSFPRRVGNPYQKIVNNIFEFKKFIEVNNGIRHVYVAIYDESLTIDKITFDIDAERIQTMNGTTYNFYTAFNTVKMLIKRIEKLGFDYIPVFSGSKGFHIHIPIKPVRIKSNEATIKAFLKKVQISIARNIPIDKQILGDVKRLIRVPNTIHPKTKLYATPLPYDFVDWNIDEIYTYAREPHEINYPIKRIKIDEIELEKKSSVEVDIDEQSGYSFSFKINSNTVFSFLKHFLRPCILEALMIDDEPPHFVRFNLVAELMHAGFTREEVFEICKQIKWKDFDERKTWYQINHIFDHKYFPDSCSSLRAKGIVCKNCGYRYWFTRDTELRGDSS